MRRSIYRNRLPSWIEQLDKDVKMVVVARAMSTLARKKRLLVRLDNGKQSLLRHGRCPLSVSGQRIVSMFRIPLRSAALTQLASRTHLLDSGAISTILSSMTQYVTVFDLGGKA